MTMTTLTNFEIFLDAVGIGCCAVTVLYLIILRRRDRGTAIKRSSEICGTFTSGASDASAETPFNSVMASINGALQTSSGRSSMEDPYDEVRRLLDLGMETHQIATKIKIPLCEIELVAGLHQMQAGHEIAIDGNPKPHIMAA